MSSEGTDCQNRGTVGGRRSTRGAIVAIVIVVAITLAALGGVGVTGADEGHQGNVVIVFEGDADTKNPSVPADTESFELTVETTSSSPYDREDLTVQGWEVASTAEGKNETSDDGRTLTYEPAAADEGREISFAANVSVGGETEKAGIRVGVATAPTAVLLRYDTPDEDNVEGAYTDLYFSALQSTDPNDGIDDLTIEWSHEGGAGTIGPFRTDSGAQIDVYGHYEVSPDDVGETFEVVLTVENRRGDRATDRINVTITDYPEDDQGDGGAGMPLPLGGSSDAGESAPGDDEGDAEEADDGPVRHSIERVDVPDVVEAGADVDVIVTLSNPNEEAHETSVFVGIEGSTAERDVELSGETTTEVTLTVTAPAAAGEYDLDVVTLDDQATASVTVEERDEPTPESNGFDWLSIIGGIVIVGLIGLAAWQVRN